MTNETSHHSGDGREEREIAALLRAAGPRTQATPEAMAEVRSAVAAEWRTTVAARQQRRRTGPWLAVASVATLAIAAWLAQPLYRQDASPVATAALVAGAVQVRHGDGAWQDLAAAGTVAAGDELMTSATGRVALHWSDGVEVRLDTGTRFEVADAHTANLHAGSAYVDAGRPGGASTRFTLTTPLGDVRHLGTQYLVHAGPDGVHVSVREGTVVIEHGREPVVARAGESVAVSVAGSVARGQVGARDPEWAWLETITPPFPIEGRSLDEFLAWAARETGRTLVYESLAAAREAESIQLKGAVTGLGPDAAVAAVLTTTPSLRAELGESQLRLKRSAD